MMIFQRLLPERDKAGPRDVYPRTVQGAARVYLQDDNMLIWFRNGVWDYRTMKLTDYDDEDFDAKIPNADQPR